MSFITSIPVIVVLQTLAAAQLLWPPHSKVGPGEGDPGKPLFLTPLLESGDITTARKLARVTSEDFCVESYAGYFTVNKTYDSNLFFWFFPARVQSHTAPVLVWLQGGPGASTLFGLFYENGPFEVRNGKIVERKYHWATTYNVLYIDNPVGTGFSFTRSFKGYSTDEIQVGENLYSSVKQFFQLFPELQKNDFFIAGESYAGKYAPALAFTVHNENPSAEMKINLKGVSIGNGLCDPEHQFVYSKYLYQIGLIDFNQARIIEELENEIIDLIQKENWEDAFSAFERLIFEDTNCVFCNMTGFDYHYNILHTKDYLVEGAYGTFIEKEDVRKAIHVGNTAYSNSSLVKLHLRQDVMKSVAPWMAELLDYYDFLIYNGQLDIIIPYASTANFLRHLNFTGSKEYETAKRYIWRVDGEVAGYVKKAGKLTEVLVRNAGHLIPTDQPKWALDMITRFTHGQAYY